MFAPRLAATRQMIDRYKRWVQEYVTEHQGKDTVVAKVTPVGPGDFVILFRPVKSEPAVAEVSFEGNKVVPSSVLQNAIGEVAIGVPYKEDTFRQYLDSAVRPLYDARGRVRVAFTRVTVQKAADVEGLAVKVAVDEGGTYNLGDVRIEGAPHFEPAKLLKAGKFKTGDLADFGEVGKGIDRIKKALSHQGFMRNDVQIVRNVDESKKVVNLVLRIDEGAQFLFGKLKIEGLDLNGESAVRKMWTHKEGTPYNPEYPEYFLSQVREEGLFDNLGDTRAEAKVDDKTRIVDVTLIFKYAPPVKRKKPESIGQDQ